MVGIELVGLGCPRFVGFTAPGDPLDPGAVSVATLTLVAMVGPTVWSKGKLRLYPELIGLVIGYLASFGLGLLKISQMREALLEPMISFPRKAGGGWLFDLSLLPAFLVASLASTLKSVGDLTLCQKMNDAEWRRTDVKSVSGGVLAGAICTTTAGLLGGLGQSTFSSNVGLSLATGATSRSIAIPCGVLLILLAFVPKLAALFAAMPQPVMGAILVYVACYMILAGVQVITSRMLDARKIFVVGISIIFGLSVDMLPGLYSGVPQSLHPIFSSSLALSTILVLLLNLFFRIGIAKRQRLELTPGLDSSDTIFRFMEEQGGAWGARREVIQRAMEAMNEFMESATELGLGSKRVSFEVTFDEFNLDVEIQYQGALMDFPVIRPTRLDFQSDNKATLKLSGFMIRQSCDSLKAEREGDTSRISLHFNH
jgi:NCS2 family nucleobase:cation symporter-2